jgi:hypothetical protein
MLIPFQANHPYRFTTRSGLGPQDAHSFKRLSRCQER